MGVVNDCKVERLSSMPESVCVKKGVRHVQLTAFESGYTPNQCTW